MQNAFCVVLSKYRLYQGIALYHSLSHHYKNFKMFVLCVDEEAYEILQELSLSDVILVKPEELHDERLAIVKENRKPNEYCWTLKPFLIEHVFNKYDFIDIAVYVDADIYFFHDPSSLFETQIEDCILLSDHDYLKKNSLLKQRCGAYNSGLLILRKCKTSLAFLRWWAEKCIEWCGSNVEPGRFGDQKYLEQATFLFDGISTITTPGVNIAPWNEKKYKICAKDQEIFVNHHALICYHFCGLRFINKDTFSLSMGMPNRILHSPYILGVQQAIAIIEQSRPDFNGYSMENNLGNKCKIYKINNQEEEVEIQ